MHLQIPDNVLSVHLHGTLKHDLPSTHEHSWAPPTPHQQKAQQCSLFSQVSSYWSVILSLRHTFSRNKPKPTNQTKKKPHSTGIIGHFRQPKTFYKIASFSEHTKKPSLDHQSIQIGSAISEKRAENTDFPRFPVLIAFQLCLLILCITVQKYC